MLTFLLFAIDKRLLGALRGLLNQGLKMCFFSWHSFTFLLVIVNISISLMLIIIGMVFPIVVIVIIAFILILVMLTKDVLTFLL